MQVFEMRPMTKHSELGFLRRIVIYMEENFHEDLAMEDVCKRFRISKTELWRQFREKLETSPIRFLWKVRADKARDMLTNAPAMSVAEIATFCGYNSNSHFSRHFKQVFGVSPRAYRNQFSGSSLVDLSPSDFPE